jgi:RNA polymerase sigma-70 factor (ECF subfamily)
MAVPLQPSLADSVEALLEGGASGNKEAERAVLQRLTGRIRRVARLLLYDAADADDAAQVALLRILASLKTREPSDTLERWADRIAVRVALQYARNERRRKNILRRWLVPDRLPWGQDTRSYLFDEPGMEELMRQLSPPQREAFVLRHMLEYTVAEIAAVTQTPRGTVKNRLLSARKKLRRVVQDSAATFRGGRR